jgi:DNA polymerase sigma
MKSSNTFEDVQPVLHAKVPIIRSRHRQLNIEIDISLHNMLVNIHSFSKKNNSFMFLFRQLKIPNY